MASLVFLVIEGKGVGCRPIAEGRYTDFAVVYAESALHEANMDALNDHMTDPTKVCLMFNQCLPPLMKGKHKKPCPSLHREANNQC